MIDGLDIDAAAAEVDEIVRRQGWQARRSAQPASESFPEGRAGCRALGYSGLLLGLPSGVDPRQSQADRAFVANRETELLEALPGRLRLDQPLLIKKLEHRPLTPRGNEAQYCSARQPRVLGWLGIVGR